MNLPDQEKLERLIHASLRELPPRRAPLSLEGRVLAEIARRALLPWWRKSFAHWPMAARVAFIVGSGVLVKLILMAMVWMQAGFQGDKVQNVIAPRFAWLESIASVLGAISGFFEIMLRSIPPIWFYGSLVIFAAMYAALFGLGAAAYRSLYANR